MRDALLVATAALVKNCTEKIEKHRQKKDEEDELQRKITVTHIIYHAIGIFYND